MALAENLVRDWGKRYQKFQDNSQAETDTEASKWFTELKGNGVTPDAFVSYGDKRADMVGELHDYEQQLKGKDKVRFKPKYVKTTYEQFFPAFKFSADVVGVQKEGIPNQMNKANRVRQ